RPEQPGPARFPSAIWRWTRSCCSNVGFSGSLPFRGHHLTDEGGTAPVNGMNFRSLLQNHPDVTQDRHSLAFSRAAAPADIADALGRQGVVVQREARARPPLEAARCVFAQFRQSGDVGPSNDMGSWHSPWQLRQGSDFPAATVLLAAIGSWI